MADAADPESADEVARRVTYAYVGAFFDELARSGVECVCVSPGSRSAPLAISAARTPGLEVVPILDERSAGFFALGLARQTGRAVALVCTSGTAASNYLPAISEAHHARVPLLVLTADRPPELRDWGAGQTIDQLGLYGSRVRRFVEVPVPAAGEALSRHARALAARAVADALASPAGPVHLNWPFREPLDPPQARPVAPARAIDTPTAAPIRVTRATATALPEDVAALAELVGEGSRGVIACGPLPPSCERDRAIVEFARAAGWPILADPTSGLRRGAHVGDAPLIAHSELWLRDAAIGRALAPDVLLRVGDAPVSKAFRLWIEATRPSHFVLIDPAGGWADPSHLATRVLRADPAALLRDVRARLPAGARNSPWLAAWLAADRRAALAIADSIAVDGVLDEPRAVHELAARLPAGATLYVSNSMPVRDLDAFLPIDPRPLRVHCNRGANGIDGVTSSALGAASAGGGPVVLLTGDLALLHDLGALLTAGHRALPLVIVVLNNGGGGIFSFLPIAAHGESVEFEKLFLTPQRADLGKLAASFGLGFTRAASWREFTGALDALLGAPLRGTHIVELPIDRDQNVVRFRALAARAIAAAAQGLST